MTIYIVKELSILDSGERSFHATPFRNKEDADKEVEKVLEGLMEDNYKIIYEDENEIDLIDKDSNTYEIVIEETELR